MTKLSNSLFFKIFRLHFGDYRFNSIFIKNLKLIMLILVVPMILLVIVIYSYNMKIINEDSINNNKNTVIKIKNEIDNLIENTKFSSLRLATNTDIGCISDFDSIGYDYGTISLIDNIQKKIIYTLSLNSYIDDIVVYFDNLDYFIAKDSAWTGYDNNNIRGIPLKAIKNTDNINNGFSLMQYGGSLFYRAYIKVFGEFRGTVIAKSNEYILSSKLKSLIQAPESHAFIIDESNKIIIDSYNTYKNENIEKIIPQINHLININGADGFIKLNKVHNTVSVIHSDNLKWYYILVSPDQLYQKQFWNMQYTLTFLIAISLIITSITSWLITFKLYRPIQIIIGVLEDPQSGLEKLDDSDYKRLDEVGFIFNSIKKTQLQNFMFRTELENKNELLKRAQSIALQAQINPHFINNTLESINWKALQILKQQNDISLMISDLSKLLRISLDSKSYMVYVGEELEHAKLYLQIQKYRYKDRFLIEWIIDEKILIYKTIKLSIQPIIENAFSHGIKDVERIGIIKVECYSGENEIIFNITDNGKGISEEHLFSIRERLADSTLLSSDHIGLVNVNQRIQLAFGLEYGIKVESTPNLCTKVIMTVPKVQ